jgi:ribonuclease VapC
MFIDASALMALLADEDEARELLERWQRTGTRLTSPLAVWQATIAVRVLDLPIAERRRRFACISC